MFADEAEDEAACVHTRPTLIREWGGFLTDGFLVRRLLELSENTVFVSGIWTAHSRGGIVVN